MDLLWFNSMAGITRNNMITIQLTQGYSTVIDERDSEQAQFIWHVRVEPSGKVYAQRRSRNTTVQLHREILDITDPDIKVDHKDGDGLNNRRLNIRVANTQQNGLNRGKQRNNTSGFKGVCYYARDKKFAARIKFNGKQKHLGFFDTAIEAAKRYDEAAKDLFGEFAYLNIQEANVS